VKQVCLGDVVKIVGGGTPSRAKSEYYNGSIPWITVKDFGDKIFLQKSQEKITEQGLKESASNLIPSGNVIIITRMAVGKVAINLIDVAINQDLKALICKPELYPKYLLFFLLGCSDNLNSQAGGATVKGITLDAVEELKISLPPLAEQKRIAAILEKCDRLRRTRHYALQLSDTFLQSVFLEMFGDPVTNYKGWDIKILSDIAHKITDGEHLNPTFYPSGFCIVMAQQVEHDGVNLSECRFVSPKDFTKFINKCRPEFNDILLVSRGATIGRSCVVNTKQSFCLMGSVILIKPNHAFINSKFLSYLVKTDSYQKILKTTSGSSAQEAIYIANLKDKQIIVPPLTLQEKFAQIVQKFERLRSQQRESERQAEHLFQTLLHRAFQGELTSSDFDDEAVSALSQEIGVKQAKPKSTGDVAEYLHTKVSQQETEAVQLTLPGLE